MLKNQLRKHLQDANDWVRKNKLTDDIKWVNQKDFTTYSAPTVDRALRRLEEEKVIAVKYDGKGHCVYRYIPPHLRSDYITTAERKELGTEVYRRSKLVVT